MWFFSPHNWSLELRRKCALKATIESHAVTTNVLAQDTTLGHVLSSWDLIISIISNTRIELAFGLTFFFSVKFAVYSNKINPWHLRHTLVLLNRKSMGLEPIKFNGCKRVKGYNFSWKSSTDIEFFPYPFPPFRPHHERLETPVLTGWHQIGSSPTFLVPYDFASCFLWRNNASIKNRSGFECRDWNGDMFDGESYIRRDKYTKSVKSCVQYSF